jgi:hypothetical protein
MEPARGAVGVGTFEVVNPSCLKNPEILDFQTNARYNPGIY